MSSPRKSLRTPSELRRTPAHAPYGGIVPIALSSIGIYLDVYKWRISYRKILGAYQNNKGGVSYRTT
jgi:hypothetical protein